MSFAFRRVLANSVPDLKPPQINAFHPRTVLSGLPLVIYMILGVSKQAEIAD
jgi:hypothetical protein